MEANRLLHRFKEVHRENKNRQIDEEGKKDTRRKTKDIMNEKRLTGLCLIYVLSTKINMERLSSPGALIVVGY